MPRRLRQCYLGPSPQRTLCLMSLPHRPPREPLDKCYITMLPDEILAKIFAYLPPEINLFHEPTYEQCPPIPLICKHWECIYDATLYRRISFVDHPEWQKHHTSRVVKTLQEQAALCKHVRDISIQKWHPSKATCRAIAATIASCHAIRTVSLHLGWSTNVRPIIQALKMLPRLKNLRLSGYDSGPSLRMILENFNQPTLKNVRLSRYGLGRGDEARGSWLPTEPSSQDDVDKLSCLASSHPSTMMSLELNRPSASPPCTKILLTWPSTLVSLSLSQLTSSAYGSHYTLDMVEPILSIHCESLQHIMVGIIPGKQKEDHSWTRDGIPNFSKFQRLRELYLSAYNILAEKPSEAAVKLAAPLLRHLGMTFCTEDQHTESRKEFAEDQVLWMADFASQKPIGERKSKVESIFVDFNPDCDGSSLYGNDHMTWPWEYLQQAEREMSRCNMNMRYSKPGCTRDEWGQIVADHRKAIEAEDEIEQYLETLEINSAGGQV